MNCQKLYSFFIICLIYLAGQPCTYAQLNLNWAHSIGSNYDNHTAVFDSDMSMDNSMVVTGWADSSADFDPGPGIVKLNNLPLELYIAKYDTSGNLMFARSVADTTAGGSESLMSLRILCDHSGNSYIIWGIYGSTSPWIYTGIGFRVNGNMIFDSIPPGKFRFFIIKYGSNGNIRSVKKMALGVELTGAIVDHHDNLIINGYFGDQGKTKDLAPGSAVALYTTTETDGFITKLNSQGHITFINLLHCLGTGNGGSSYIFPGSIAVDSKDNILFGIGLQGIYDIDGGPDTNIFSAMKPHCLLEKLDSSGNFVYRKKICAGYAFRIDANDNIYTWGGFSGTVDVDPGPNAVIITSNDDEDILIVKYGKNGNYLFSKHISGSGAHEDHIHDFQITKDNKFFLFADSEDSTAFAPIGIPTIGQCSPYGKKIIVQMDSMLNAFYYDEISNSHDSSAYYPRILSDNLNNIYLCGSYTGRFDADFSPAVYYLENPNVNPLYHIGSAVISKYTFPPNLGPFAFHEPESGLNTEKIISERENDVIGFSIVANSSSPSTSFSFENSVQNSGIMLRVFSIAGQLVIQNTINLNRENVRLNLHQGMYVVQICSGTEILRSGKLIAY